MEDHNLFLNRSGMRVVGVNNIGDDAYFIRSTDYDDYYLHPVGEFAETLTYRLSPGALGAAIWEIEKAVEFIKISGVNNIEPIKVSLVLGNADGSAN